MTVGAGLSTEGTRWPPPETGTRRASLMGHVSQLAAALHVRFAWCRGSEGAPEVRGTLATGRGDAHDQADCYRLQDREGRKSKQAMTARTRAYSTTLASRRGTSRSDLERRLRLHQASLSHRHPRRCPKVQGAQPAGPKGPLRSVNSHRFSHSNPYEDRAFRCR